MAIIKADLFSFFMLNIVLGFQYVEKHWLHKQSCVSNSEILITGNLTIMNSNKK